MRGHLRAIGSVLLPERLPHLVDDVGLMGKAIVSLLGEHRLAEPDREFAPVARDQLDVVDFIECVLERVRQTGGAWLIVSRYAVTDLNSVHL